MNRPKISVLCPVYNNVEFLPKCFDSIINQTLGDIEILLGEDGSPDRRAAIICDKYAEKDNRIIVDHHENMGGGKTLNRLLDMATGDYIAEIDCDDEYESDALETLWNESKGGAIDFVKASYNAWLDGKEYPVPLWDDSLTQTIFNPLELDVYTQHMFLGASPSLWCGIYRRQFMIDNDIRWLETPAALYQDTSMTLKLKVLANSVRVFNKTVYRYNMDNPNNSTKQAGNIFALANEYDEVERMLKRKGINIWESFGRIRFMGCMWLLDRIKTEDKDIALSKIAEDMRKETIFRPFYEQDDLNVLRWLGVIDGT